MKTVKKSMLIAPAFVLLCALFITGCPQPFENKPNIPSDPDPNLKIENGVLKGYNGTPSGTLVIPADITEIAPYAFSGCTSLTAVDFSSCTRLTKIGGGAFFECTGITGTVVFPANLETIGGSAFYSCSNVDGFDFSQCKRLTSIGSWAFTKCTKIKAVDLPASLETIKGDAFEGCTELKKLTVQTGGSLVAEKDIIYNRDKTKIFCSAPKIESIDFPPDIKEIEEAAFKSCTNLKALNLPDSVESLGFQAFSGCTGITGRVRLPKNLTTIGVSAFYSCNKITGFDFSQSINLAEIHNLAFANCTQIETVNLPASLKTIVGDAFSGCTKLETIMVDPANTSLKVQGNIIYDKRQPGRLLCSARRIRSVNFPANLTERAIGAFSGCTRLAEADLSSCTDLKIIGTDAFSGCTGLLQLKLPANLKTIDGFAFNGCRGIEGSVVLPEKLETIGMLAFNGCSRIDEFDFSKCTALTAIGSSAFSYCKSGAAFKVKKGSAIKAMLIASGVAENQIVEVE